MFARDLVLARVDERTVADDVAAADEERVDAVRRREHERGQAVVRALANQARLIRLPVHVELLLGKYLRAKEHLTRELGRPPEPREIAADGIFVAIGHDPNTALFLDWLDHDEQGYLVTEPGSTRTNIPGVFAAGDVQDHTYRQAVTAAGSGTMAALDSQRFLDEERHHREVAATSA